MALWGSPLPTDQFIGLTQRRQDVRLSSPTDKGQPKRRQRFTAAIRFVKVPLILTGDQKAAFDDLFITDCANGTLPFDWEDPDSDETVEFRFGEGGYPELTLELGGSTGDRVWTGSVDLEIWP